MYRNGIDAEITHKYLGKEGEHTVFEAELVGAIMGAHLASSMNRGTTIGVSNQAAIRTSPADKEMASQHLVDSLQKRPWLFQHAAVDKKLPPYESRDTTETADEESEESRKRKKSSLRITLHNPPPHPLCKLRSQLVKLLHY